jgi:hypothetical protein
VSGADFILQPHMLATFPYYSSASIRASLYGLIFKKVISLIGWNHKKSFSFLLGVNDLQIYGSALDIALSYSTSIRKAALGINKLEVSINYSF